MSKSELKRINVQKGRPMMEGVEEEDWLEIPAFLRNPENLAKEQDREKCPDCGRLKARNADDCAVGDCDKWYAVNDKEAVAECESIAAHTDKTLEQNAL